MHPRCQELHEAIKKLDLKKIKGLIESKETSEDKSEFFYRNQSPTEYLIHKVEFPTEKDDFDRYKKEKDNYLSICKYLHEKINEPYGQTPLHFATIYGKADFASAFIEEWKPKPDLWAKDKFGYTAYDCGRKKVKKIIAAEDPSGVAEALKLHEAKSSSNIEIVSDSEVTIDGKQYKAEEKPLAKSTNGVVYRLKPTVHDEKNIVQYVLKVTNGGKSAYSPPNWDEEGEINFALFGVGKTKGDVLVMKDLGKSLNEFLHENEPDKSPVEVRFSVAILIINALQEFHSKHQRIHLDLHNDNILLKKNKEGNPNAANLIDFGASSQIGKFAKKFIAAPIEDLDVDKENLPPECFKISLAMPSMDAWALGLVLDKMFSDNEIPERLTLFQGLRQHDPSKRFTLTDTYSFFRNLIDGKPATLPKLLPDESQKQLSGPPTPADRGDSKQGDPPSAAPVLPGSPYKNRYIRRSAAGRR